MGSVDTTEATGTAQATRFVESLAARDYRDIFEALAPDVRFRFLVPRGPDHLTGAAEVAAKYLGWFGDADSLEVLDVSVQPLPGRISARYRFRVHRDDWEVIEQQSYLDLDEDGRIAGIDLLCSGFRTLEDREAAMSSKHEFDAGTMGCADGLAQEFRRRILAIPVGDELVVETTDPAAKEDLPPLARMMGHTVLAVEAPGDGRLLITVERGK
jgi:TusA-related sulfurtransferase